MKTNNFSFRNTFIYPSFIFFSILLTSCGSYQNSSYYDSDGIYGTTESRNTERVVTNNPYKNYFSSLQNDSAPTEIFTDVTDYSNYESLNDTLQNSSTNYADWGNNPKTTSINVYTSPWSISSGFGFGYPYFGYSYPYYGYGHPYYGSFYYGYDYPYYSWGFPSYNYGYSYYHGGGYSNYYGYNNRHYSYNSGRRGSSYSNTTSVNRYSQNRIGTYNGTNPANYRNSEINNATRNSTLLNRKSNVQTQNNYPNNFNRSRTTDNNAQQNTDYSRNQNYTPTRSYTPSSNNSSNSGSYNGGRSYNGGGGGGRRGGR